MAKFNQKDALDLAKQYAESRKSLDEVEVEILPEPNSVDSLILLRILNGEKSFDEMVYLTELLTRNKQIRMTLHGEELTNFIFAGNGSIAPLFQDPVLLDILVNITYGILLKKLTLPSKTTAPVEGSQDSTVVSKKTA